jgi:hypothetical protein
MRRESIAFSLASLLAGCSADQPAGSIEFIVQVLGTKSSFERYRVSGTGLTPSAPRYSTPWYMQELRLVRSLECSEHPNVWLLVQDASGQISSQQVSPFLCGGSSECVERTRSGWLASETHQLFLDSDGKLLRNTDFERRLTYSCQWATADHTPVDGTGGFQADAGACTDELREGTTLTLRESATAATVGNPSVCNGYLLGDGFGVLVAQVTFAQTGYDTVVLNLAHCKAAQVETYPLMLTAAELVATSCAQGGASLILTDGATERRLRPIAGYWQILDVDESRDGSQRGLVDLVFGEPGDEPEFEIQGDISLPDVQIPGASK